MNYTHFILITSLSADCTLSDILHFKQNNQVSMLFLIFCFFCLLMLLL